MFIPKTSSFFYFKIKRALETFSFLLSHCFYFLITILKLLSRLLSKVELSPFVDDSSLSKLVEVLVKEEEEELLIDVELEEVFTLGSHAQLPSIVDDISNIAKINIFFIMSPSLLVFSK